MREQNNNKIPWSENARWSGNAPMGALPKICAKQKAVGDHAGVSLTRQDYPGGLLHKFLDPRTLAMVHGAARQCQPLKK